MALGEHVVEDYASLSLSLKCHPLTLLRDQLTARGLVPAARLARVRSGQKLAVAGLVTVRQRPGTAKGVIFLTLEDETAIANLIVTPPVFEKYRKELISARLLAASGRVENRERVVHLLADRLWDLTPLLATLSETGTPERDFPDGRNFH